jgi:hypothetical protein
VIKTNKIQNSEINSSSYVYNVYVDDSGTPSLKDNTIYYVISGVILHIYDLHILGK